MVRLKIVVISLLVILLIRFVFFYNQKNNYQNGQVVNFETTLLNEPQFLGNYQKFTLNLPQGEPVFVTTSALPEYKYGDRITISSTLIKQVINKRTIYSLKFPKISLVKTKNSPLLAVTIFVRQSVTDLYNKALPADLSSLMLGIVFGIKAPMTKEFTQALRLSGVFHVIAASGMNVTLIGGFISSILVLFLRRQTALVLSIFGILFYVFLAGMQPSIVRASIMGILVFTAQILGRQTLASYSLFLAAFLMLFVSPNLISDVGFQLSFAATLGLLYIRPLFEKMGKLKQLVAKFPLSEDLFVTFSAQIATLPILLLTFGTYSLWSIVVNSLVLWTIAPLMILGAIAAITGLVLPGLASIFIYFSLPFLLYFQKVVSFFSSLQGAITIVDVPLSFVLAYYLFLLALVMYFSKAKND